MIGTTLLNRYYLEAELGRGGMGVVYRAQDTLLNRPVAVKLLSAGSLGTEGRQRLLIEAQAAARLNHPNIVNVYDVNESDGVPFIVMELAAGNTLRDAQPATMEEVIAIARQVTAALEHAHASGILHRDLKLENIVLSDSRMVKLMDFGLARISDAARLTQEGMLMGTFSYLSPELIQGDPASPQSDLYALGVMLYELAAGRAPFAGDTLVAVLSQHLHAPVIPPSTFNPAVPPRLDALIVNLLSKNPAERPASAANVRQTLEAFNRSDSTITGRIQEPILLERLARGRMVGREREFAEAGAVWQRAQAGEGHVLLISGEPGIGKTRLMREVMTLAELSRATVLTGECYAEGGPPYAPIAQMIRTAWDKSTPIELPANVLADLATIAPDLRRHYPHLSANPPLEPQAEQQRLFESVATSCSQLAAHKPLLLVLDDAHWADSGSLALLRHLARRARQQRLLILITYRELELDENRPLPSLLHDLHRERLATRLKLTRLTLDQTRDMLTILFAEEVTTEFLDGIYRETEGNPFFIEEVCKTLIEGGQLYREGGRWQRPRMAEMEIPQSVRLTVQARVGKLPAEAQEALRLAAIIGREFDFELLQAISDLDEDRLIDALEQAERAQLISESRTHKRRADNMTFTFAHALIPSTLRDEVSGLRRRRLHRRTGLALEQLYPDRLDELAPRLGRHFAEAAEVDKAITYLLRAGDQARHAFAFTEAIEQYQQAVAFLKEKGDHDQAARALMKLGLIYHTIFDFQRSREAYQESFTLWQRAGDQQPDAAPPPAPHPLRLNWANPSGLEGGRQGDIQSGAIIDQLFSGLVELTPDLDIAPSVARAWEILENGRQYIFHLRSDARWSDGEPVTAGDFACAWQRALEPGQPLIATYLKDIKGATAYYEGQGGWEGVGVSVPDPLTLVVQLEEPASYFLYVLAHSMSRPVPRHVVEKHGDQWTAVGHLVSNGPYHLETWQPNELITLVRNPLYFGRCAGNIERIELSLDININNRLDNYAVGNLDMVTELWQFSPVEYARIRQHYAGDYISLPSPSTLYICFNSGRPPLDDLRVRLALAHATNREKLIEVDAQGYFTPATGGFVPPGIPGHTPDIALSHDLELARRLLAEAGYPGGQGFPAINFLAPEGTRILYEGLIEEWQAQLGIQVELESLDWPTFIERLDRDHPFIFWIAWLADYPDPDNFLRVGLSQRYWQEWDEPYRQFIEQARRLAARSERLRFYQQADRYLVENAIVFPVAYGRWHLLFKPWVKKFPLSPMKWWYWKDVILEPHEGT
jgi:ABC-type oligopeptide transport system substrate-binding subunit